MPARVARPARKFFLNDHKTFFQRPLDLGRFHRKNLNNLDRSTLVACRSATTGDACQSKKARTIYCNPWLHPVQGIAAGSRRRQLPS